MDQEGEKKNGEGGARGAEEMGTKE